MGSTGGGGTSGVFSNRLRVDKNDCPKVCCFRGDGVELEGEVEVDATTDGSMSAGMGMGISGARAEFMVRMVRMKVWEMIQLRMLSRRDDQRDNAQAYVGV